MLYPNKMYRHRHLLNKVDIFPIQVLKIYFYENGGQRNLELTIDTDDINKAGKR